jgi:hypothetical protein
MKNQSFKVWIALFAVCIMSFLFVGCKENESLSIEEQVTKQLVAPTIENGVLKFVDMNQFKATFEDLMKNQNSNYLRQWEDKFPKYISMKQAYKNLTENEKLKIAGSKSNKGYEGFLTIIQEGENIEAIRNSEHPIYSILFNEDGLVLIGKDAYKLEYNKIIKINSYDEDKLKGVLKGELSSEMQVATFKTNKVSMINKNSKISSITDLDRECHDVYIGNRAFTAYFNLYGAFEVDFFGWNPDIGFGGFSGVCAIAKHRKRFAGIWFANDAPVLRMTGVFSTYSIDYGSQYIPIDSGNCNNCSETSFAYFWSYQADTYGWVKSSGTGDDGNYHECQISR